MEARVHVVSLGVADIAKARAFYCEGLGFAACKGTNEHIVFLDAGGVLLALYGRAALAEDAHLADADTVGKFGGIALARNVRSKAEVDAFLARAQRHGGKIVKPAQEVFWGGYSGYFTDLDGHPWEIAYNSKWTLDAHDGVRLERL
jgi:uncharacterized protein